MLQQLEDPGAGRSWRLQGGVGFSGRQACRHVSALILPWWSGSRVPFLIIRHISERKRCSKRLAAYERLRSSQAKRDSIAGVKGDDSALSRRRRCEASAFSSAKAAASLVTAAGVSLTTISTTIGLKSDDPGRSAVPGIAPGLPLFRNSEPARGRAHGPYTYDGSLATLADVVDHYAGGLVQRPSLATSLVRDLRLTDDEKQITHRVFAYAFSKTTQRWMKLLGTTRPTPKK